MAPEMVPLPTLPWPHSLFSNVAAFEKVPPTVLREKLKPEDLCHCGCKLPHRQNIPQTMHSAYGAGWMVIYFRHDTCKSRFNRARVAR